MGYYSTINAFDFQSGLSLEELKKAQAEFAKRLDEKTRLYFEDDFYSFEKVSEGHGLYEYELSMSDYFTKNYADQELAEFISTVIAPGTHAVIELVGEGGERWGYLVLSGEVYMIEYVEKVDGLDMAEFLLRREEEKGETAKNESHC